MPIRSHRKHGPGSWAPIAAIFAIGAGLLIYQRHYLNHRRPLIRVAITEADKEGSRLLQKIGVPDGARPEDEESREYSDRGSRSMWRGVPSRITWQRQWEAPGDFSTIVDWYSARLFADGWSAFDSTPPSTVKREFKRDRWILTVWRMADFTYPIRTRIQLELIWDYWAD